MRRKTTPINFKVPVTQASTLYSPATDILDIPTNHGTSDSHTKQVEKEKDKRTDSLAQEHHIAQNCLEIFKRWQREYRRQFNRSTSTDASTHQRISSVEDGSNKLLSESNRQSLSSTQTDIVSSTRLFSIKKAQDTEWMMETNFEELKNLPEPKRLRRDSSEDILTSEDTLKNEDTLMSECSVDKQPEPAFSGLVELTLAAGYLPDIDKKRKRGVVTKVNGASKKKRKYYLSQEEADKSREDLRNTREDAHELEMEGIPLDTPFRYTRSQQRELNSILPRSGLKIPPSSDGSPVQESKKARPRSEFEFHETGAYAKTRVEKPHLEREKLDQVPKRMNRARSLRASRTEI
ncbi:uncharacterized protein L3040_003834 [Drepanopeziza brunnea f. sp. 'multigermtubi']|uniref:Uncharacterized protein n=1 Tax=Marssonina brunnea f. sp. multigermtubi (strain MB_m1) TaxID=1072389 RepID=K1XQT7_MARBU|nr:uncharacterized protein MBM_06730 [Drepanopeziza brunnea f. sp. 'multigermtubi' MB_m1]EKD14969.1 hypothetical protein MBM_06730 [Drepanopeziza brunnea f. sp. 'multigermtubi' MB_m1]KAJ5046595.1 hypothetical protein L3040_003834 [Drepanopeziza brunnea f. sp. 'multigermtubi']